MKGSKAGGAALWPASLLPSSRITRWTALILLVIGGVVALDRLCPPDLTRLDTVGTEVVDRQGRTIALLPAPGGVWRFRGDAARISPVFRDLLLAVEDKRFWWHPGIDPLALARASLQWAQAGKVVSGGSTLSMQAARLLEPRPRNLPSKLIEMFRAVQLEARFGKQGVLDIWLTLAPFGGNLEGVRAGSLAWFGVPPEALEPAQAALLVAIPRRPEALRPDRHPARVEILRARVLQTGGQAGLFDVAHLDVLEMPTQRLRLPHLAPQVTVSLPRTPLVNTTLDRALQTALERLGTERLQSLGERVSLAMLIAEAEPRELRALFAGDWDGLGRAGTLDLTRAVRSPGSALKPFVYGMAFQDGIAGPETMLADLPRRFGNYAPENFDHGFAGTVSAREALRRSLNLPATALLERIGPVRFAAALRGAGVSLQLPKGADPSLPLALGGAGITLRDLAALYAALATDGAVAPLRLVAGEQPAPRQLLGRAVAQAVATMLTHPVPGGGPPGIAWMTGTSWGGREAWAMGFDARHVVGVWVGRPDGTPLPGATGLSVALPLLARVFDLLPAHPRPAMEAARVPATASIAAEAGRAAVDMPRLLFPPPGAVLAADGPVTIRVMGGRRPFTFLVDGAPIPAEAVRRETSWRPASPGFYRLTVLDADGAAAHAGVRVR